MKNILLIWLALVSACNLPTPVKKSEHYAIVIHGGAGGMRQENMTSAQQKAYAQELEAALNKGYSILENKGSAIDAVQSAIISMENAPLFNAGKGAVYNSDGNQEMDASIMEGNGLNSGAVAGVNHIKNPILAARMVMDSSSHVMLSGKGAEILARKHHLNMVDSSYFFTQKRMNQFNKEQGRHQASNKKEDLIDDHKFGTVGAVAIDQEGNIAAGTSTGGISNKKYGRIGDSPIIGAGTYANNLTCGISATGTGEYFIRTVAAHEVSNLIQYKGLQPDEALREVIFKQIAPMGGEGGMILIDKKGSVYWDFNSNGMYRAYKKSSGEMVIKLFGKE
ncbi:MAG: isoaspartyl peptidase/L-asparaginase [Lutibacter sp.]|jgi:beta-aspartyl-peptidase (threonine type)|nr:isoaspartyl peptidase/L-asparaginase [Lutibacter sp.]